MTGDAEKFKMLDETITAKVRFGDGSTVEIQGKGVRMETNGCCQRYITSLNYAIILSVLVSLLKQDIEL